MRLRNEGSPYDRSPVLSKQKAVWGPFRVERMRLDAGECREHTHVQHSLIVPVTGCFTQECQTPTGRALKARVTGQQLCVVPAGQPHRGEWSDALDDIVVYLDPLHLEEAAADLRRRPEARLIEQVATADPLLFQLVRALGRELEVGEDREPVYTESLLHTLSLHLLRHHTVADPYRATTGQLAHQVLQRALEYVEDCLDQRLLLADVAKAVYVSQFHFARAFRQSTGVSFHQYVLQRRVERARTLLAGSSLPLTEVARKVGLNRPSHLGTVFRRATGTTPAAYRREMGNRRHQPDSD